MNNKMKEKIKFVCNNCGYTSYKWLGKCPECQSWGSFIEEVQDEIIDNKYLAACQKTSSSPLALDDIKKDLMQRWETGCPEFDKTIGGGIMPGSLILLGGDPGIGKSTLMLQIADSIAKDKKILYVSGEESIEQIKSRSERLAITSKNIFILNEICLERIFSAVEELKPDMLIIDSIQTIFSKMINSAAATVSQIKWVANQLLELAKTTYMPIFIIGHITKEGLIAGPKLLEHIVDTVLYFEGDKFHLYRILRVIKNRFGPINEVCIFEMDANGLKVIKNPSEFFLAGRAEASAGSAILPCIEGSKSFLIEVQALVSPSYFGNSRRSSVGIDINRMNMLVAVLEKKLEYNLGSQDIFLNIAGGISIDDPAADLAIAAAIISSYLNKIVADKTVLFGEIGLTGEVRPVYYAESRIKEAINVGFNTCILPLINKNKLSSQPNNINLIGVKNVQETISYLWK
jgi:DNA repair protein RadA/Sms